MFAMEHIKARDCAAVKFVNTMLNIEVLSGIQAVGVIMLSMDTATA
jgi:hypothetical protein